MVPLHRHRPAPRRSQFQYPTPALPCCLPPLPPPTRSFFQARPHTCQWYWGMRWDHVVSYDMAHWERLPPAIVPTPGGTDADGCFSGAIQVMQTAAAAVTKLHTLVALYLSRRDCMSLRDPFHLGGHWPVSCDKHIY